MKFARVYVSFALIQHPDVTAQRNRRQSVLGALSIVGPPNWRTEANRKSQHFDATTPGNPKMAVLVKCHQNTEGDQRRQNCPQKFHSLRHPACHVLAAEYVLQHWPLHDYPKLQLPQDFPAHD